MPNSYYYLIASLPYLLFEKDPPITRKAFLSECEKWVAPEKLVKLTAVDMNDMEVRPSDPFVLREWKKFDFVLRKEIAEVRRSGGISARKKIPMEIQGIFEAQTPLLMERSILKKKWDFIEETGFGFHFDFNALVVYFLKVGILERMAMFNTEKGKETFEALSEAKEITRGAL